MKKIVNRKKIVDRKGKKMRGGVGRVEGKRKCFKAISQNSPDDISGFCFHASSP